MALMMNEPTTDAIGMSNAVLDYLRKASGAVKQSLDAK